MRSTRRQKRSWGRVRWVIALIVIVAGLVYAWNNLGLRGAMRGTTPEAGQMTAENVVHVMILGVDQREDDVGRSDTLMVATIDTDSGKGALLSVPRDTRLAIEGHGYDKANHAYAFGGHELSMKTVEKLFGVKLDGSSEGKAADGEESEEGASEEEAKTESAWNRNRIGDIAVPEFPAQVVCDDYDVRVTLKDITEYERDDQILLINFTAENSAANTRRVQIRDLFINGLQVNGDLTETVEPGSTKELSCHDLQSSPFLRRDFGD